MNDETVRGPLQHHVGRILDLLRALDHDACVLGDMRACELEAIIDALRCENDDLRAERDNLLKAVLKALPLLGYENFCKVQAVLKE